MPTVLLIEDEPSYVEALEVALPREGYEFHSAPDGREGLRSFRDLAPDLVLLDLMLPGLSGLDVLRQIRRDEETPVIVLSAKDAEADVVAALELGADDYLTKPYSTRELVARMGVALRRSATAQGASAERYAAGGAVLDVGRHRLLLDGRPVALPRKEFGVLRMLMAAAGKVVTREDILEEVWGYDWRVETKTLDQHIRRIRRRLEVCETAPRIETIRGVGYRIES